MRLVSPKIRLVNQHLRDPNIYVMGGLEDGVELTIGNSIRFHELKENSIVLLMHLSLSLSKEEKSDLLHTDYLCIIDTSESIDHSSPLKVDKKELAHYLGICIIMIRGSLMTMLQHHPLDGFTFPILNPTEMLEGCLTVENNNFILENEKVNKLHS